MDIWEVLGIDRTKDKESIKNAYREKLINVNPEDDSEGFMQLRDAYEEALREADLDDAPVAEETELMRELRTLYDDFERRIDTEEWKLIFNRDEFVRLDTADESMHVLLRFLMQHNYLPHDVFKLIVNTLEIREKKKELEEQYPEDFISFILNNAEYDDYINYALFENTNENVDKFIHIYYGLNDALADGNLEEEQTYIEQLEQTGIHHPYVDIAKLRHTLHEINTQVESNKERTEKYGDKIKELLRQAKEILDKYPDDAYFMIICGDFAMVGGAYEDAKKYYDMAGATGQNDYAVMGRMGDLYYALGEYEKSRDLFMDMMDIDSYDNRAIRGMMAANEGMIEKLTKEISDNPSDEKLKLQLTWCYYRNNLMQSALEVLTGFSPSDENKCEYNNLLGRAYLYTGSYEKALDCFFTWKTELETFPEKDRPKTERQKKKGYVNYYSVCFFIGECYLKMKNYDEARKYLELSLEKEHILITNSHESMCVLEYECGNYETCISECEALLEKEESYMAYLNMAKSFYRLGEYGRTIDACEHAILLYPYNDSPYELELEIYWDYDETEDMKRILERYDSLGIESDSMKMYKARLLGLEDNYTASNELLMALLEKEERDNSDLWDDFDIYITLGANYSNLGEEEQALKYYGEALFRDTENKELRLRLASIHHVLGEFGDAIHCSEYVLEMSNNESYRERAYVIKAASLSCMHDFEAAKAVYEECEAELGLDGNYVLDHAELLVRMDNLEGCVELLNRCISELGDSSLVQYCMGNLCMHYGNQGYLEKAEETFLLAAEHKPDDYLIYRLMGNIYIDHKMYEKAKGMLVKAIELDTEERSFIYGRYLFAVGKTDDITKPEYQKYIERAIKQVEDADDAYTYNRKAEVYLALKNYDEALKAVDMSISQKRERLSPFLEYHAAWCVKAEIYEDMGENEKALECYKKALEIYGHDALYEGRIKSLSQEV